MRQISKSRSGPSNSAMRSSNTADTVLRRPLGPKVLLLKDRPNIPSSSRLPIFGVEVLRASVGLLGPRLGSSSLRGTIWSKGSTKEPLPVQTGLLDDCEDGPLPE